MYCIRVAYVDTAINLIWFDFDLKQLNRTGIMHSLKKPGDYFIISTFEDIEQSDILLWFN